MWIELYKIAPSLSRNWEIATVIITYRNPHNLCSTSVLHEGHFSWGIRAANGLDSSLVWRNKVSSRYCIPTVSIPSKRNQFLIDIQFSIAKRRCRTPHPNVLLEVGHFISKEAEGSIESVWSFLYPQIEHGEGLARVDLFEDDLNFMMTWTVQ